VKPLFWVNAALLAAHAAHAGWLRRWELAGLPLGAAGFAILQASAVVLLLLGYAAVAQERRSAALWSMALAACGLAAAGAHGWRLWAAAAERGGTSIALAAALALASLVLLAAARFERRVHQRSAGRGGRVFLDLKIDGQL
jgi:hypothetical protein